jgi:hypothetical protein
VAATLSRRGWLAALAAVAAAAALAAAAWRWHAQPRFDMARELARIADAQDLWANPFERNREKAQALLAAAAAERDPRRRFAQRREAARELVLAADAEPAIALLRELLDEATTLPPAEHEALRFELALAYLRLGESQNCVWSHNAESCLIPIRGAGVHAHRLGATEAIRILGELLREAPAGAPAAPMYRWLLNVAHMTLGGYPQDVPPQWRIPESAFASDHDIGRFADSALRRGLAINQRAGGSILDDFDGDGDLDLMVSSWGQRDPLRYFANRGDGMFEERTEQTGLAGITGGLDLFPGDYDNDGDLDVFVPRGAWTHLAGRIPGSLLENRGGGRFRDVTARAGVLSPLPSQAAVWCDLDNDGWLDLVKGNEIHADVDWPAGTKNVELFRNARDGRFEEIAAQAGLAARGMIKAVVCGDYDNDGWMDLYFSVIYGPNLLFRNLGVRDGVPRFADVTAQAGVAEPAMSFTTWFFDYDNDGWEDLFVSCYATDMANLALEYLGERERAQGYRPRLYRNQGDGSFRDVAPELGADALTLTMGANYGDLDNDGWLDYYLTTGAPPVQVLDPARMLRNDAGRRFQDVTTSGGFGHLQKGHGVSFGDIDGDGDQDVFAQVGGAFTGDAFWSVLFENPLNNGPGPVNDWITLRLTGVKANRGAIGARISTRVRYADGTVRAIHNTVSSGGSFGASSLQQEIGLGRGATIDSIEIRWPGSGTVQVFSAPIAVNRVYRIVEGEQELHAP